MITAVAYGIMCLGLILAAWTGFDAYRRRAASTATMVAALVVEVLLIVQSGIAISRLIGSAEVNEPITFVAYSVGVLLPLPLGVYLARLERTRWGSISLCFTAVVVAVMMLRLLQLWRIGPVHV
ncbi:hypothetical protein EH165_11220 [Nakamurella antarctica]|uniref:Integral membrane protein n=1 Tax=Nakamurella antarctica TaxID=1902245 RepID=A0A3G8ZNA6_9ACTN|nr:hypothetical protein [Nakamurella antarctica]AZI58618.1 hypothetical protein EH165_11220 [Nakamurella antarctica]